MADEKRDVTRAAEASTPKLRWDTSELKTSYSNVCNVLSTREEVTFLFGMNQSYQMGEPELTVQLSNRIILSPYVAKRFLTLLQNVVADHEKRFESLNIDTDTVH